VGEKFGRTCCRETIRVALHRLKLSWKKAKKLLGRADPERRQVFVERIQDLLTGAQCDRHRLVYLDEAMWKNPKQGTLSPEIKGRIPPKYA
jgi:hypothetical protein